MGSEIIIYQTEDGLTKIETTFDGDTVWLSIDQMAELFQRNKSTISRHMKDIFNEGELTRNSVVANFATTAADGKTYQVDYYNLDVIISVGYRVKSLRGTQFRIWASSILKEYMKKGFGISNNLLKNNIVEFILMSFCRTFVIFVHQKKHSKEKCLISTQQVWTMTTEQRYLLYFQDSTE